MGDISTIVTMGFGTFGSVNLLPVMGFYLAPAATDTGTSYVNFEHQYVFGSLL